MRPVRSASLLRDRVIAPYDAEVSVIRGYWTSEEEQRNFGQATAAALPGGLATHALIVDGDEFWHEPRVASSHDSGYIAAVKTCDPDTRHVIPRHPVELDRALALVATRAASIAWVRATMATYWKSIRTAVAPPEPLKILWLVALGAVATPSRGGADPGAERPDSGGGTDGGGPRCFFSKARDLACTGVRDEEELESLGTLLDVSVGVCHHLSYVRTNEELTQARARGGMCGRWPCRRPSAIRARRSRGRARAQTVCARAERCRTAARSRPRL